MRGVVCINMEGVEGMNAGVISGEGERKTEQSSAESSREENKVLERKSFFLLQRYFFSLPRF